MASLLRWVICAGILCQRPGSCYRMKRRQSGPKPVDDTREQIRTLLKDTVSKAIVDLQLSPDHVSFSVSHSERKLEEERRETMKVCADSEDRIGYTYNVDVNWRAAAKTVTCLSMFVNAPSADTVECATFWRAGCPDTTHESGHVMFGCNSAIGWVGSQDLEQPCGIRATQLAQIANAVASMPNVLQKKHKYFFPVWSLADQATMACYYPDPYHVEASSDEADFDEAKKKVKQKAQIEYTEYGQLSDVTALKYGRTFYDQYFGFEYVDPADPLHKKLPRTEASLRAWKNLGMMKVSELEACVDEEYRNQIDIDKFVRLSGLAKNASSAANILVKDLARAIFAHGQSQSSSVSYDDCNTVMEFYSDIVKGTYVDMERCIEPGLSDLMWTESRPVRLVDGWPLDD